jgi:hypothetical protein
MERARVRKRYSNSTAKAIGNIKLNGYYTVGWAGYVFLECS